MQRQIEGEREGVRGCKLRVNGKADPLFKAEEDIANTDAIYRSKTPMVCVSPGLHLGSAWSPREPRSRRKGRLAPRSTAEPRCAGLLPGT